MDIKHKRYSKYTFKQCYQTTRIKKSKYKERIKLQGFSVAEGMGGESFQPENGNTAVTKTIMEKSKQYFWVLNTRNEGVT